MRPLISRAGRQHLAALCSQRVLVALDFDGTLAPLMDRPERVRFLPHTRDLVRAVAERYPVAVVSGRALRDLSSLLAGSGVRWLVGNHGAEESERKSAAGHVREVARWRRLLEVQLAAIGHIWLEDKGSSLSVHLRGPRPGAAALRVRQLLDGIIQVRNGAAGMRVMGGKRILNLVPAAAPHKGDAVLRLMKRARCESVLYVGDDVTDEDVFSLGRPAKVNGVRVGRSRYSRADWWISHPQVDVLLSMLVQLRSG
jgi:trehalose 6-phosphate phosphatase